MDSNPSSVLNSALSIRDASGVRQAIRAGADLSGAYGDGLDIVSAALYVGPEILEAVLAEEADPDARLGTDLYPLERAIIHQDLDSVRLLVRYGASLDMVRNDDGDTAIHRCAYDGSLAIAEFLYETAPTHVLNRLNYTGDSALSIAVGKRAHAVVDLLLKRKVAPTPIAQNDIVPVLPLVVAVETGDEIMVDKLLRFGANPLAQGWMGVTALGRAAELNRILLVEKLKVVAAEWPE